MKVRTESGSSVKERVLKRLGGGSSNPTGRPSWMITDPDQQRAAEKQAQAMSGRNRPPEFWLRDGEEKPVRFRTNKPILIWRYSMQVRGDWRQFTAPSDGETDLFQTEAGLQPALKAVYEVIDIEGYVDKKGKRQKNISRFFACNQRMEAQLKKIREKRGPLTGYNIEISREGEGTKTVYSFFPDAPSPMTPQMKAAPDLMKDFAKFYAPPSEPEQRALLSRKIAQNAAEESGNGTDGDDPY